MRRKEIFAQEEYYHVYGRTILGIPEFEDYKNANRLIRAFLIANSTNSSEAFLFLKNNKNATISDLVDIIKQGEKLVNILCYCIMPNHYHLVLQELQEGGISDFIKKCNTSIANYINKKQDRRGPLFESRFKAKHIDNNEYLLHLSLYIHLNPLDIISGKSWREGKLKNWKEAKKKLLAYPYSSLKSFLEEKNYDLIISGAEIIAEQFDSKKDYELFLQQWSDESLTDNLEKILID